MAKKGLSYVVCAKIDESTGEEVYSDPKKWGPSSSFGIQPTSSSVKDYGDNGVAEEDTSVTEATVNVELNEMTLELESYLLGHEIDPETKEMVSKITDVAPYIGMGCIGESLRNNVPIYRGIVVCKTKLQEPNDEYQTKKGSVEFTHTSLTGTAVATVKKRTTRKKEFETYDEAKAWLNGIFGITEAGA